MLQRSTLSFLLYECPSFLNDCWLFDHLSLSLSLSLSVTHTHTFCLLPPPYSGLSDSRSSM